MTIEVVGIDVDPAKIISQQVVPEKEMCPELFSQRIAFRASGVPRDLHGVARGF